MAIEYRKRKQTKPRYRERDGWVLCECVRCGRHNYVEPHGTTAACACSPGGAWVEHRNLGRNES